MPAGPCTTPYLSIRCHMFWLDASLVDSCTGNDGFGYGLRL